MNTNTNSSRPAMPLPARKSINQEDVSKFVSGAAEKVIPPAAEEQPLEKAPVAAANQTSQLVPTVGMGDIITMTLSLKRKPTVGTRGKSQLFRVTQNETQLVQAVLEATKFKSAQEIFEVVFIGGIKFMAQQLAASDPAIQKLLDQEDQSEAS